MERDRESAAAERVCEAMLERGAGSLIFVSSFVGYTAAMPEAAAYAASKAGLVGLTRAMAIDLAPRKIRVNAVAPGAVDTDMTRVQPEEVRARMAKAEPLGRLIDPQTIAASIAFLARPDTYINGHILVVDGGRAAGIMPG